MELRKESGQEYKQRTNTGRRTTKWQRKKDRNNESYYAFQWLYVRKPEA
jgi:hypothetical protein